MQFNTGGKAATAVKLSHLWIKITNIIFVYKIMHNFKIRSNFVKDLIKSNLYLGCILWQSVKSDFTLKNKSIFTLNDTRLDKRIDYNYITDLITIPSIDTHSHSL